MTTPDDPSSPAAVPPYVPLRHSRWPSHRMPRWLLLAGAVLLAGVVLVGWSHRPTRGQRAADMNSFLDQMTTDIQSCAGGVRESLFALNQISSGAETDVPTATKIARDGADNCLPVNSMQISDLAHYQVHESLASYHLDEAVKDLWTWASPDAVDVQNDVAAVLSSHGAARAAAERKLQQDRRTLNDQRDLIYSIIRPAASATSATAKLPALPG